MTTSHQQFVGQLQAPGQRPRDVKMTLDRRPNLTRQERDAGLLWTDGRYEVGDVRRYGAVGDGSTDDSEALINAGKANQSVFIHPTLNCRITKALTGAAIANQIWWGGGEISTAASPSFTAFTITSDNTVFDGIRFTSTGTPTAHLISFESGAEESGCRNCYMSGTYSGARFNAADNCFFINNHVIAPSNWGVNVQTNCDRVRVLGNYIESVVVEHGIYLAGTASDVTRCVVDGNIIRNSDDNGIKVTEASNCIVSNNQVDGSGQAGIYLNVDVVGCVVSGNNVTGGSTWGIEIFEDAGSSTSNLITGNYCANNTSGQININSSNNNSVVGNLCNGSGDGIQINGSNNCLVSGNTLTSATVGIDIASGTGNELYGNKFNSCTTDVNNSGTSTIQDTTYIGSTSWDPGSIADGDEEAKGITVTGAVVGDYVDVSFSLDLQDLQLTGSVTAANTVTAVLSNSTGGPIDLGSGTVNARVTKL